MLFVLGLETLTIKMKINFLPIADVLSRIKYLVSETLDWGGVDKFARILPAKMSSMSFSTNERPGLTTTDQSQAWKGTNRSALPASSDPPHSWTRAALDLDRVNKNI